MNLYRSIVILFICCIAPIVGHASLNSVNKIVAVVNGEMITLHELRARTAIELARNNISFTDPSVPGRLRSSLESMIDDMLLRQEGKRLKITIDDSEIDPEVRRLVQGSRMSQKDFEAKLATQGSNMAALREQIRNRILHQRMFNFMVSRKISVPQEELLQYYETHKSEFTTEKSVDFSVIVFSPSVNAEQLYKDIKKGTTSFEETARKYSVDSNAKNGGRVGVVPWNRLPKPMQTVFTQLKAGEMTPLVRIDSNLGTLKVNKKVEGGAVLPFEAVKEQVENKVREPLVQERLQEYVKQLRSKAVIDIRL